MSDKDLTDATDNVNVDITEDDSVHVDDPDNDNDSEKYAQSHKTPKKEYINTDTETDSEGTDTDFTDFTRKTVDIDAKISEEIKKEFLNLESEHEFNEHLQGKLDKLNGRLKKLQQKYYSYKTWYDRLNIMIIIISSVLSIIEALRNEMIHMTDGNKTWSVIFNMVPLSISTFITGTAAVIQFQKYQEKMENMQFTKEKVILAISKLKHVQEMIWFSKPDEFEKIKLKYLHDIYTFYSESSSELERQLKSA
jgi:hypothetical protein